MHYDSLRVAPSDLNHLTDLLLLRDENPHIYDLVACSPALGLFTAKMISADEIEDLADVVARVDEAAGAADGSVTDMIEALGGDVVQSPLEYSLFAESFTGTAWPVNDSYPKEQLDEMRNVARGSLPAESLPLLMRMQSYGSVKLLDVLNFLSSGDTEARRQVLISYPLATCVLIENEAFRSEVDSRREISPFLSRNLELDASQMRIFTRFERAISELSYRQDNELGSSIPLKMTSRYNSPQHNAPDLSQVRSLARDASTRMKLEQLSDGREAADHTDTLLALRAFNIASEGQRSTNLGAAPFDRVLRRVQAGQWGDASERLSKQISKLATLHDYTRTTATKIATAILVDRFRRDQEIDMDLIADAAHRVLADEQVDPAAAEDLGTFLTALNTRSWMINQLSTHFARVVGDHSSLKVISEANARWHHIHDRIDNELMSTPENLEWPPMLGQVELDGILFRELHSSEDLIAQGQREDHCVGSYSRHVLGASKGQLTLIFSIDDPASGTLSTAEITAEKTRINDDTFTYSWSCPQHQARSNTPPCPRAVRAVAGLLEHLDALPKDEVEAYIGQIMQDPQNLKDALARSISTFGANVCDPGLPERTVSAIASTLPKSLRDTSIEGWKKLLEEQLEYTNPIQDIGDTVHEAMAKMQPELEPAAQ